MNKLNWSEQKEATNQIPYSHVILGTPLGSYVISWKGWKEYPSYDVELDNLYIGIEYDLESAKNLVTNHLVKTYTELHTLLFK